jgi:integrase
LPISNRPGVLHFASELRLGAQFSREPRWREHWINEPEERVNELRGDQGERLLAAARVDYAPILRLAEATGLRQRELLLRWSEVDWDNARIVKPGKGLAE